MVRTGGRGPSGQSRRWPYLSNNVAGFQLLDITSRGAMALRCDRCLWFSLPLSLSLPTKQTVLLASCVCFGCSLARFIFLRERAVDFWRLPKVNKNLASVTGRLVSAIAMPMAGSSLLDSTRSTRRVRKQVNLKLAENWRAR